MKIDYREPLINVPWMILGFLNRWTVLTLSNHNIIHEQKIVKKTQKCKRTKGFAIKSQNPRIFGDSEFLINAIAGYPFRNSAADSFLKFYSHHAFPITVFQSNYCTINVHQQHIRIKCVKYFIANYYYFFKN